LDNGEVLKTIGSLIFRKAAAPTAPPAIKLNGRNDIANLWNNYGGEIARQAALNGIPTETALAVFSIEAAAGAYDAATGLITIRFEDRVFSKRSGLTCFARRGGQKAEWENLERNAALNFQAAIESTSWGLPQLMGFNYDVTPYPTSMAMVEAFQTSVVDQIKGFFQYVSKRGLIPYVHAQDWRGFTRLYNGKGNVDAYSAKLINALASVKAYKNAGAKFGA
jgi:hypothetical protein